MRRPIESTPLIGHVSGFVVYQELHRFCDVWDYRNAMYQKLDKELIETLKKALASDPTNIDAANRYWKALGAWQCGGDVIEAFRPAALASRKGVIALAHAYRELFESSGEGPRPGYFDKELSRAMEVSLEGLPENESATVRWILDSIRSSRA